MHHLLQSGQQRSVRRLTKNVSPATRKIWGGSWKQRNENTRNWICPIVVDKPIHGSAKQKSSAHLTEFSAPLSSKKWPAEKTGDIWHRNEFRQTQLFYLQEEWDPTEQSENSENWLTLLSLHSSARTSCYHEACHFHYSTAEQVLMVSTLTCLNRVLDSDHICDFTRHHPLSGLLFWNDGEVWGHLNS
jgi:hypothetical protein